MCLPSTTGVFSLDFRCFSALYLEFLYFIPKKKKGIYEISAEAAQQEILKMTSWRNMANIR